MKKSEPDLLVKTWFLCPVIYRGAIIWGQRRRRETEEGPRGRGIGSNRRQTEREQEGTKEGQSEEIEWLRSDPPVQLSAHRHLFFISLQHLSPSWRIFLLIPAVTVENRPRRCVPNCILPPCLPFHFSPHFYTNEMRTVPPFRRRGWQRMVLISQRKYFPEF